MPDCALIPSMFRPRRLSVVGTHETSSNGTTVVSCTHRLGCEIMGLAFFTTSYSHQVHLQLVLGVCSLKSLTLVMIVISYVRFPAAEAFSGTSKHGQVHGRRVSEVTRSFEAPCRGFF